MSADRIMEALGLGELLARDVLAVQLIVLAATAVIFAMAVAILLMAAQATGRARRARLEVETHLRSAQDAVVEARQISAQFERAKARAAASEMAPPIRVSARETTPEAEVVIFDDKRSDAVSSRNLAAAKESATVPKKLLRRRRF